MSSGSSNKVIASSFGLGGFAVAIIAGMAVGNPTTRVLTVAIASMISCHFIGLIASAVGEKVVNEYLVQYRAARPLGGAADSPAESSSTVKVNSAVS